MRIPIIKIREQRGDRVTERLVGTNRHDVLSVEHGGIYYTNIQCMAGTKYPEESGMTFVAEDDGDYSFTGHPEIQMASVEEFLDMLKEQIKKEADDEIERQIILKKIMGVFDADRKAEKKLEDYEKDEGWVQHT